MSYRASTWARRQACGGSTARQLLCELAYVANDESKRSGFGRVWPPLHTWVSIAYLVDATELDRKSVLGGLKRLEDLGLIEAVGTDGRTNQSKVYRLPVTDEWTSPEIGTGSASGTGTDYGTGTGPENGTSPLPAPVPVLPSTGTAFPVHRSQKRDTEHRFNNEGTKDKARKRAAPSALVNVDVLIQAGVDRQHAADWLAVRKAKKLPLTATAWASTLDEAVKAGLPIGDAIKRSASEGWAGFKASWLQRDQAGQGRGGNEPVDAFAGAH